MYMYIHRHVYGISHDKKYLCISKKTHHLYTKTYIICTLKITQNI